MQIARVLFAVTLQSAQIVGITQLGANLFEDFVRDDFLGIRELEIGKKEASFFHGEFTDFRDRLFRDSNGAGFGAKARPTAFRTSCITAISTEKHTDVQFVFFAFEPREETFDAIEIVFGIAFEDEAALFGGKLTPRYVRGDAAAASPFL